MNRTIWKYRSFTKDNPIQYPCPNCNTGILKPIFVELEITKAGQWYMEQNYPYGIEHIFSGIYKCSQASCNHLTSFGGICTKDEIDVEELANGDRIEKRVDTYEPKFFYPNLKLFPLELSVPEKVAEQINLSFANFFNDLSSSANRIRNSIELILDAINAPKFHIMEIKSKCPLAHSSCSRHKPTVKRQREEFTNLHQRITYFAKKKNKKIGDLMLANKIIGNEGSHIGKVEVEDILDAYEILEEILNLLFIKRSERIVKIAKEINALNKPRSKR